MRSEKFWGLGCKLGYLPKFRSAYLTCARFKIQIWISWILNPDHKLCSIHSQPWSPVSHLTCYHTIQTHQRSIKGDIIYMYSQWLLVIHFKESLYKRIEAMQYDQIFNNNKKSQRWKSLCAHRSTNVHNEPEGPVTFSLYQTLRPGSEAGRVELRVNTTPVMRGVLSLATLHCYFRSIRIFSGQDKTRQDKIYFG